MKKTAILGVIAILAAWFALPMAGVSMAAPHACCRAHGEHHCAESAPAGAEHNIAAQCPYHSAATLGVSSGTPVFEFRLSFLQSATPLAVLLSEDSAFQAVHQQPGRAPPAALV